MNKFIPFSKKQLLVLNWWCSNSDVHNKNGIICDGAVRSGKTLCMSISFICWAFYNFSDTSFALCGKTITSLRRNVITPLLPVLKDLGFSCDYKISRNYLEISRDKNTNRFYIFGGRDESSASLIQGMTLGGVMLDEVALMPRSFVEQALARCSLEKSKYFFNCNPEHPYHWFYLEWIKKSEEKNVLYLHFNMDDNPSLSKSVKNRYKSLYSGVFYERFIEGKWVVADGLVYPMFDYSRHIKEYNGDFSEYYLSCDYGTVNPFSLGLWGKGTDGWYRINEYYHSSRDAGVQLTDEEYYSALENLANGRKISAVIIDPSAASFIQTVKRHGEYKVIKADNDVISGINRVCQALKNGEIFFSSACTDTVREFSIYRWDNSIRRDAPKKENDHAMDDIRYFVSTVLNKNEVSVPFASVVIERK
ncbi:MAG: PBSX family phage terminase large subunit [Acetobacter sp.]|nr:PBSX family phage terminase large subunit [Bacteroides sp.]MCM1341720.1 PBSX family phage terminase large subunit [Acetobacter sp.]MCM1432341.1 PBSX family phage terminase large subunit [Clostridiales bacterium]